MQQQRNNLAYSLCLKFGLYYVGISDDLEFYKDKKYKLKKQTKKQY